MARKTENLITKAAGVFQSYRWPGKWPAAVSYYCIVFILVLSIPAVFLISAMEIVRLILISIGLIYVQKRWQKQALLEQNYPTAPGSKSNGTMPWKSLFAVTLIFVITQFDLGKHVLTWYSLVTTGLVLCAFSFGVVGKKWGWSEAYRSMDPLDWVVLITGLGVILVAIGSFSWFATSQELHITSIIKVGNYLLIWFTITRLVDGPKESFKYGLNPWQRITRLIHVLFVIAILAGAVRLGASLYFYTIAGNHFNQASYETAIVPYEKWVALNRSLDLWANKGLANIAHIYGLNYEGHKFTSVLDLLREQQSDTEKGHKAVGDVYYGLDMWDKAIQEYRLVGVERNGSEITEKLGTAYLRGGYLRWLMSLIRKDGFPETMSPSNLKSTAEVASVAMIAGDYGKAVELYEKLAVESDSGWNEYYGLGKALIAMRRIEDAATALEAAAKNPDADADVHYQLGLCYDRLGRPGRATLQYETAVRLLPSHRAALQEILKIKGANNGDSGSLDWSLSAITPDVLVNKQLGDDLDLVGYSFIKEHVTLGDVFRFKMYWRMRADTLSIPERSHYALCEENASECITSIGPYFSSSIDKWQAGEVVVVEHELPVPVLEKKGMQVSGPLNLVVNVLYKQDENLRRGLFLDKTIETQEWWWSPSFKIPLSIEVED